MSQVPSELLYAKSHEWLKSGADGLALIGITDYAQNSLGDITYVQLPKVGTVLARGASFGVVESVKAASDIYSPISGTVVAINEALTSAPETVNHAPYTDGWLIQIRPSSAAEAAELLNAAAYETSLG